MEIGLSLSLTSNKGVGVRAPAGFTLLTDTDGAYLRDTDGAYLMETI